MPRKPRGRGRIEPQERPVPERPTREALFVACPLCAMNRKLEKTGQWAEVRGKVLDSPKKTSFGSFDLERAFFIQVRDVSGGRGRGFALLRGLTLREALERGEFFELRGQLIEACRAILAVATADPDITLPVVGQNKRSTQAKP